MSVPLEPLPRTKSAPSLWDREARRSPWPLPGRSTPRVTRTSLSQLRIVRLQLLQFLCRRNELVPYNLLRSPKTLASLDFAHLQEKNPEN
ncbi:ZNF571 isoform 7 [Pan troglodytes]|uniref:ZNF571 isoform 7 n=1 Tax=Pan troglodytes TaxID=9598 RepID=A0A2J8QIN5_PANTR|nr:ZNF571 isoform 7 [Pan troglodytes]